MVVFGHGDLLVTSIAAGRAAVLPVAAYAIAHIEAAVLINTIHCLNRAVAIRTLETFGNVHLMGEVDVLRDFMNAHPFNGLTGIVKLRQLDDVRLVDRYHAVAIHADIQSGNRGVGGTLDVRVTIQARNVIIARVNFVAIG
jgi:hypothetical protein